MWVLRCICFFFFGIFALNSRSLSIQEKIENLQSVKVKNAFINLEFHHLDVKNIDPVVFMRISFLHIPDALQKSLGVTKQQLQISYIKIKMDIEDILKKDHKKNWRWTKEDLEDDIKLENKDLKITYSNLIYND